MLLQSYFNNVIVLQSTKEGCSWLGKIKNIETPGMLIKSDMLAMTPDGSLYPSSADMSSTALIYLPDTSPMRNGCRKHAGMNSIYCLSCNAVHENMGFAPSTVVGRVLQLHDIATTLVLWPYSIRSSVESVHPTPFLVSQKASSTKGFTFRPVCCLSYAMIDIDHGETLIFAILSSTTAPCTSLCMIILYGGSPLSPPRINQR